MKIYVDFADCLCETARYYSGLVKEMFDLDVPYEGIRFFELQKSFALEQKPYEQMMEAAHRPEALLAYEETPGAADTLNCWVDAGHDVRIITGRPFGAYGPSRQWLDRHGLDRVPLYHLNKYGRDSFYDQSDVNLSLEDYYKMRFDIAVEDSPLAFRFFDHLPDLRVLVYDRPWNHDCSLPGPGYHRCPDWAAIDDIVSKS
jgi:hypothetical protein